MLPLTRSRNRARFFGIPFSPSTLFQGGTVAGAWYDPSDLSTMFDTSAGTTPVAMPGQGAPVPVGLMLDKSQGLVLGSELVTNGDFSNGLTGWTAPANWVASSGGATITSSSTFEPLEQTILVPGKNYKITFDVVSISSGTLTVVSRNPAITSTVISNITTAGAKSFIYTVPSGETVLTFARLSGTTLTCTIDNVSVRELPGNHAISFNNTTARPELRARVNLLTYSEEFDNGAWTNLNGVTISQNVAVAPDGTTTADKLIAPNSTGTVRVVRQALSSGVNGASYVSSFYAKYVSGEFAWVRALATDAGVVWFDIQNGVKGTESGGATGTITPVGNGWYRCAVVATANSVNIYSYLNPVDADGSTTTTGDGSKGVLIWGADLRPANIGANVPAYQRIADANTYDTAGFPLYLRFDGIDDSMYTPANLNLSGTDKVAVFAGVRKLSDAAQGVVAELSATIASNNGTFLLAAPDGATQTYGWDSKGTTQVDAVASSLAAPRTNVLVGTADIAGDSCIIRVNGAVADTETGDQGTGNYGTYPLYIGARNNSSLWFNGHLYSLVVAGSAVSAGNISATEQWVAQKTGLVIP